MKKINVKKAFIIGIKGVGLGLLCATAIGGMYIVGGINEIFGEENGRLVLNTFTEAGKRYFKVKS